MEELVVTRYWMAGVMAIMIIFAALAIVGYVIRNKRHSRTQGELP